MVEDSEYTMLKASHKLLVTGGEPPCSDFPPHANKNEILLRSLLTALDATMPDFTD